MRRGVPPCGTVQMVEPNVVAEAVEVREDALKPCALGEPLGLSLAVVPAEELSRVCDTDHAIRVWVALDRRETTAARFVVEHALDGALDSACADVDHEATRELRAIVAFTNVVVRGESRGGAQRRCGERKPRARDSRGLQLTYAEDHSASAQRDEVSESIPVGHLRRVDDPEQHIIQNGRRDEPPCSNAMQRFGQSILDAARATVGARNPREHRRVALRGIVGDLDAATGRTADALPTRGRRDERTPKVGITAAGVTRARPDSCVRTHVG
jgi:hypothetical protein